MSARGSTPAEGESQNLDQPRAVRPRASPGKARYHVGSGLQVGTGIPRRRSGTGTRRAAGTVPRGRGEQNPPPLPANSPDSPPPRPVASQCVILSLTFVKWNQTASAARPLSLRSPESSLPSRAAWLRAMRTVSPLPAPLCLPPPRLSHAGLFPGCGRQQDTALSPSRMQVPGGVGRAPACAMGWGDHGVSVCPSWEIQPRRLPGSHSQLGVSSRGSTPSPTPGVLRVCVLAAWSVRGGVSRGCHWQVPGKD